MTRRNRSIEAFAIYNLKNERLPEDIPGMQLRPGQLRELLENLPAMLVAPEGEQDVKGDTYQTGENTWHIEIGSPNGEQLEIDYSEGVEGINDSPYHLEQPTELHKRSYVIEDQDFLGWWQDEHGHDYSAVTLKGNNYSNPKIIEHANASTGYIPYGHQESYVIERVLRASAIMRAAGISTEYIIGLAEPKRFPWPVFRKQDDKGEWEPAQLSGHIMLGLQEHKQRMIHDKWSRLPEKERSAEALIELMEKFKDMTFYTTARAMDTEYRIADMTNAETLQDVFMSFDLHYGKDHGMPDLNPYVRQDVDKYFDDFLMPALGVNFARLHKMGLIHGFANSLNLTAFGSIVDLDSIHGEPLGLGDSPVTAKQKVLDIASVVSSVWEIYQSVRLCGRELDIDDMPRNCIMQFMVQYFNETINQFDDREKASKYLADLLMELQWLELDSNHMAGQLKPFMQEAATACYFVFFHNVDMLEFKDEISGSISKAIEAFHLDKNRNRITKELLKLVKGKKQNIMAMLQSDIAKQYIKGEDFDVVSALFCSNSIGAQLMRADLFEKIAKTLLKKSVEKIYIEKARQLSLSDPRETSLLWQFSQSVQQGRIFDAIAKVGEVAGNYSLVDLYMGDSKTLGYKIADSVLKHRLNGNKTSTGIYGAQEGVSFAENELWLFTQGVPFYEIDDLIKDDIRVETDYIIAPENDDRISREGGATIIAVSSKTEGYHLTQIVTDGKMLQMIADVNTPGQIQMAFGNENRPVYILTVEEDGKGNRRVTKLIDSERFSEAAEYIFNMVDLDRVENEELFSIDDLKS